MFHLHFSISGGCSWEGLKRTPGGTKILFCGYGLNLFSSLRETNSKTTHYLLSYFCRFNILKGNHKAPTVELVRLNSSKDAKTAVITLKKVRRALPRPFYMGISQGLSKRNQNRDGAWISDLCIDFFRFYIFVFSLVLVSIEKINQTLKAMFDQITEYLKVRQKYSAARRIFNLFLRLEMW